MNSVDRFVLYEPSLEAKLRSAETNFNKTWDLQLANHCLHDRGQACLL